MDRYLVVESAAKTLRAKIAFGSGVTLQGDENIGEFAAEQFGVKKVVGLLKGLVLGSRNIFRVGSRFHGSDVETRVFLVNGDHHAGRLDNCRSNLAFLQTERDATEKKARKIPRAPWLNRYSAKYAALAL